ncbi:MAG: MarR family transcriptional regulator [Alphaproteobacteria bacterium]|nr:MarR family transcriptional regulator [Alphaproteobacteria bacterium]MBV9695259.1 MarR family transcriptional regulator [Alphaproteobacteria bacterium]
MNAFDRDLLIVLHDVARLIRTRFDQRARAYGMTRAQWIILARLNRQPGMSQNELAGICEVEPITVGRLIDRLEARGLVERRPDATDRRIKRLHLLPAAEPILNEITRSREALDSEITQDLNLPMRESLVDGLLHIKARLNAEPENAPKLVAGE